MKDSILLFVETAEFISVVDIISNTLEDEIILPINTELHSISSSNFPPLPEAVGGSIAATDPTHKRVVSPRKDVKTKKKREKEIINIHDT